MRLRPAALEHATGDVYGLARASGPAPGSGVASTPLCGRLSSWRAGDDPVTMVDAMCTAPDGSTKTVSVLIVDDQHPFRDVARTVIGMTDGFEVAGEAASGEEAVEM